MDIGCRLQQSVRRLGCRQCERTAMSFYLKTLRRATDLMSKNQTLTLSSIGRFLPFVYIGHEPVCMCPFLCFFSGLISHMNCLWKIEFSLLFMIHLYDLSHFCNSWVSLFCNEVQVTGVVGCNWNRKPSNRQHSCSNLGITQKTFF